MKLIAIIGASGHGKVVAEIAELCGYEVTFFDDAYPSIKFNEHWEVAGTINDLLSKKAQYKDAVIAVGNNKVRTNLFNLLSNESFEFPVLCHPKAIVSKYANINSGTVILAGAVINAFTKIGFNSIVNTGAIVEHDCIIGNGVHLSPNVSLAGGAKVGDSTWLGIGSVTKQLVEIGANSLVGANSTVIRNIPSNVTAFGSPAVITKYH